VPVGLEEELRRVIPVIRGLRARTTALISVDTMKADVARAAVEAGADIINDVSGFRDERMTEVAAACDAGLIVMHMQGLPGTMQQEPRYGDVVSEVRGFFQTRLKTLEDAGIAAGRVALDPGIGFGKTPRHNLALLRALSQLRTGDRPLVLGVSRKSFIGHLVGDMTMDLRDWPTVALTAWMRESGADMMRVHDVRPNVEALRMIEAVCASGRE
jgi:dihydropteroate synthase